MRAIARKDLAGVLLSGTFVHLSWLVSIAIGAFSMTEILSDFNWEYLPVVACSLAGGLIGSYLGLKK